MELTEQIQLCLKCLVWQKAKEPLWNTSFYAYKHACSLFFIKRIINDKENIFFKYLSLGLDKKILQELQNKIIAFLNKDLDLYAKYYLDNNEAQMIPTILLFIEWILRAQRGHLLPCPESVKDFIPFESLTNLKDSESFKKNFLNLAEILHKDSSAKHFIFSEALISLTSINTKETVDFKKYSSQINLRSDYFLEKKHFSSEIHLKKRHKDLSLKITDEEEILHTKTFDESAPKNENNLLKENEKHKAIRKDIEKKLYEMKKTSSKSFLKLKERYLNSLDYNSKQLILSVQEKMRPELFELHLQQRLIKYFCENPYQLETNKDS